MKTVVFQTLLYPTDGAGHCKEYLIANLESELKYFETKGES